MLYCFILRVKLTFTFYFTSMGQQRFDQKCNMLKTSNTITISKNTTDLLIKAVFHVSTYFALLE